VCRIANPNPIAKNVLIHIGTHKTGTTSIQKLCAHAADQMREDGILYPKTGRPKARNVSWGHHTLAWSIQRKRGLTGLEGWHEVKDEVASCDASQVLLSSEAFVTCTVGQIRRIRSFFPNAMVQALVYLRNPLDYMMSVYSQYVRRYGETQPFRELAVEKMHLCDYSTLIDRWREGLGESVIVRSFEVHRKNEDLETDFFGVLGLNPKTYKTFKVAPVNVSPSEDQLLVTRWLNRLQERDWTPDQFLHLVKRNVLRGTWRGRVLSWVVRMFQQEELYAPEDAQWFENQINEETRELMKNLD